MKEQDICRISQAIEAHKPVRCPSTLQSTDPPAYSQLLQSHTILFRVLLFATDLHGNAIVAVPPCTNALDPFSLKSLDVGIWIPNHRRMIFSYRGSTFSAFVVDSADASTELNVGIFLFTNLGYHGDVLVVKHSTKEDEDVYDLWDHEVPVVEAALLWCVTHCMRSCLLKLRRLFQQDSMPSQVTHLDM